MTRVSGPVVLALVATCVAGPAEASFPGKNGRIVYGWIGESAYRAGPTATSIRTVDPGTGAVRVLSDCPLRTDAPVVYTDCSVGSPRYSPDGSRLAFVLVRTTPDFTGKPWVTEPFLGLMAADGSAVETHGAQHRYDALAWAPRGDRLLVQRMLPRYPATGLFLASLDGTEQGQVGRDSSMAPDWSSRGEIAFTRDRGADPTCRGNCQDVFVRRLGAPPRRLTYRGGFSPSWSPRGTKVAFARPHKRGAGTDVFLVGRDGRGRRRVTRRGGYGLSWSPDGRWIAFIRNGDLFVVRTNGDRRRRLVDAPFGDFEGPGVASVDWQPLPAATADRAASPPGPSPSAAP